MAVSFGFVSVHDSECCDRSFTYKNMRDMRIGYVDSMTVTAGFLSVKFPELPTGKNLDLDDEASKTQRRKKKGKEKMLN